jgi:ABC-2 type transport system ATP-binding protein
VSTAPAIEVTELSKRYGTLTALTGLTMTVHAGELVALLGPNGAGKTTTVEIIEGYRRRDGGSVRILGEDPAAGSRALKARVGLMLQGGGFDPRSQPRETLIQYGRFHRSPRDADELIELVGLGAVSGTPYKRLSGGERQRMSLAVALVGRPEVAILDEPTAGMDPEARAVTRAIVADLRSRGVAVLMTSHDLTDVERLADRICILDGGRLVVAGTPAELTAGARPRLRFRLDRTITADEGRTLQMTLGERHQGVRLSPATDDGWYLVDEVAPEPALVATLAAWCEAAGLLIVEARTSDGSLEDAYLELVRAGRERPTDRERPA